MELPHKEAVYSQRAVPSVPKDGKGADLGICGSLPRDLGLALVCAEKAGRGICGDPRGGLSSPGGFHRLGDVIRTVQPTLIRLKMAPGM